MKSIIKTNRLDFIIVSGTSILCAAMTFLYSIIVRKYVGPYDYGIFVTVNILLLYLNYLQVGVLNSYNRDYPQLLGGDNIEKADYKKNVVWTFLITVYGIIAIVSSIIFFILWINGKLETKMFVGFTVNSILAFLTVTYGFFDATIRSNGKFKYSSFMLILKTLISIFVGVISVIYFGMYGLLMSAVISLVIVYIFNLKFFLSLKLKTDIKMVLDMIRTGAPLLINGLVWTLMMSIDRFVILAFMTMTDLGIYSVALLGFSTLVLIPQSIAQVFYIKMSQDYGATNDVEILFNNAAKFTKILSLLSALISLLAYFSLPILIKFVMPKYIEGVVPAQILIIGVSLYSTTMLFSSVLNILKLNFKLLISTCILCLVSPILSISFIGIFGKSINSVAIGSSLSYLLYSLVVIIVTCKALHKKIFRILFISWVPVIFLILPCILISIFVNNFIMQVSFSIALIMLFLYTLYSRVLKSSIVTGGK